MGKTSAVFKDAYVSLFCDTPMALVTERNHHGSYPKKVQKVHKYIYN